MLDAGNILQRTVIGRSLVRRWIGGAAIAAALMLPAAAGADSWSEPHSASAAGEYLIEHDLGATAAGATGWLAWSGARDGRYSWVWARRINPNGSLGSKRLLAGGTSRRPRVAAYGRGSAWIAWERDRRKRNGGDIWAARFSRSGDRGRPVRVFGWSRPPRNVQAAATPRGQLLTAWENSGGGERIAARLVRGARSLGPVAPISPHSQDFGTECGEYVSECSFVGIDDSGRWRVAWAERGQVRTRVGSGTARDAESRLSLGTESASNPQLAVNPEGATLIGWRTADATGDRASVRMVDRTGLAGPVQVVSPAGSDASNPSVALNGRGRGFLVWHRYSGQGITLYGRAIDDQRRLGPVRPLSRRSSRSTYPTLASGPDGRFHVAWRYETGRRLGVAYRSVSAGGDPGAVETVWSTRKKGEGGGTVYGPDLALVRGGPVVSWVHSQIFDGQIRQSLLVSARSAFRARSGL